METKQQPPIDLKTALRTTHLNRHILWLTRFRMAACSSVVVCALMAGLYFYGMVPAAVVAQGTVLVLGSVGFFYVIFRSGVNTRAADPSLTGPMTASSVVALLCVMYGSSTLRETFPIFFGLILLFGVFRFSMRSLFFHVFMILGGYAIVLALTWSQGAPAAQVSADITRWLVLATVLPLFAIIGSQIIGGRRAAVTKLAASEERFRRLTALSSDWYWETNAALEFVTVSPGIATMSNIAPARVLGSTLVALTPDASAHPFAAYHDAVARHRSYANIECRVADDKGATRWLAINGEPILDAAGTFMGYYGTGRDITERKLAEVQVRFEAHHDALTGLPNRALFDNRIAHAMARMRRDGEQLWVLFLDLDRFKLINDSLGHQAGDTVLQHVAKRLRSVVRESDTVARTGGDEFVLLLDDTPAGSLSGDSIRQIMQCVGEPVSIGETDLVVCASIGIAIYPQDGDSAARLVEHADVAMYHAKQAGRNQYRFYTAQMNERALSRLQMESDLREALDRQQFVLHYQPMIALDTNTIVGAEALLRWHHPRLGLLLPCDFIGIAEETGLIIPIGAWVLTQACMQARAWQTNAQAPVRVAVNLSARQFKQHDIVLDVEGALHASRLDASLLELEITESMMLGDAELAADTLQALKALGATIALDDFGTGYSSLSYLKRFPIDVLKIDRTFVRDISVDPDDAAIVAAIIALAHTLGMTVTAEGVEQPDQLAYLANRHCDVIQGHLMSMPLEAAAFDDLLRHRQPLVARMS